MANSKRKCKQCKTFHQATNGIVANLGFFCSNDCRVNWGIDNATRLKEKARQSREKTQRKELKRAKEKLKTKTEWLNDLQTIFNKYIRLRDQKESCISCDRPPHWKGQWHASHYYSRGHSSYLRFNLWNVHKSCSICNNHLSGNIEHYTPKLIEKIGQERFDYLLENKARVADFDIDYIKRAIKVCKKAVKRLERRYNRF